MTKTLKILHFREHSKIIKNINLSFFCRNINILIFLINTDPNTNAIWIGFGPIVNYQIIKNIIIFAGLQNHLRF